MLISTEAGGEGRNFQFCHRLVLFDLPWNPAVVEQRIGRLDRIGRTLPTEIVYFRPPSRPGPRRRRGSTSGSASSTSRWAASSASCAHVTQAIERRRGRGPGARSGQTAFAPVLDDAPRGARPACGRRPTTSCTATPTARRWRPEILARVPPDLESARPRTWCCAPLARFGFERRAAERQEHLADRVRPRGAGRSPAGRAHGSRFLGTFDREEAVERRPSTSSPPATRWSRASSPSWRTARAAAWPCSRRWRTRRPSACSRSTAGAPSSRPWRSTPRAAGATTSRPAHGGGPRARAGRDPKWTQQAAWGKTIRRLAAALPTGDEPHALAAFRLRRRG